MKHVHALNIHRSWPQLQLALIQVVQSVVTLKMFGAMTNLWKPH